MPDPPGADVKGWPPDLGGKGSPDEQRIVEAYQACQRYERFMSDDGVEGPVTPEEFAAWRAYVACMRDHGIDMDDPDPGNGGSRPMWRFERKQYPPAELLDQAMRACEVLRRAAGEIAHRRGPA
jgi:hypothetical protein